MTHKTMTDDRKTLRDIIAENLPEKLNDEIWGGVSGCPFEYKILDKYYQKPCSEFYGRLEEKCEVCWGQFAYERKKRR